MINFTKIAEVSVNTNDTLEAVLQKVNTLLSLGFDMLAFSDRARADDEIANIQYLLKLGIFEKLSPEKFLSILATRTKLPEEIDEIVKNLINQNVKNLLVVTGDPHKNSRNNFLTSLDIIPKLSKNFAVGAAVHADIVSLDRDIKKVQSGAKFLIVQACYENEKWNAWIKEAMELGLNKKARIFQTVIPLTNKAILESMHDLHDVSLPEETYNELSAFDEAKLKEYGVTNAIAQIKEAQQNNFFSGVYVYSKDREVLEKILNSFTLT